MQYNATATKSGKGEGIPQNEPLYKDHKFNFLGQAHRMDATLWDS